MNYPAHQVDPIIRDLTSQLESALLIAKTANDQLAQIQSENKVLLEKVAHTQSLDAQEIDRALDHLEDMGVLISGREKVASDLAQDPNNALALLSHVVSISAEAAQQGSGLPKTASAFNNASRSHESDPDGWGFVVKHGA